MSIPLDLAFDWQPRKYFAMHFLGLNGIMSQGIVSAETQKCLPYNAWNDIAVFGFVLLTETAKRNIHHSTMDGVLVIQWMNIEETRGLFESLHGNT